MTTLYQIVDELLEIAAGEEVPTDFDLRLEAIFPRLEEKIDNICRLVRELESQAGAKRAEAKRLGDGARVAEARVAWLKEYMQRHLDRAGLKTFRTPLFSLTRTANSQPSILFDGDASSLPPGLRKVTVELDRQACREVLKAGGQLPEEIRVVTGEHLRIT